MGGDHSPRPEVQGSVLAARELGVGVDAGWPASVGERELAMHERLSAWLRIELVSRRLK